MLLIFALQITLFTLQAQEEIKLYSSSPKFDNEIKNPEKRDDRDFVTYIASPRMYFYPASKSISKGVSVIICPGGGYWGVSSKKEGSDIAQWFNSLGVSAFVLYYRMPNGHYQVPLSDAQQALKLVRKGAKTWGLDKNKVGIMGFSAGGHLASTLGTHFKNSAQRPDFMILGYPVVTMKDDFAHKGSRNKLFGDTVPAKLITLFSNELRVTKKTPPTFIVHAKNDKAVPIENSRQLYKALKEKNISAELLELEVGGHGFGMLKYGNEVDAWPDILKAWLKTNKLIP